MERPAADAIPGYEAFMFRLKSDGRYVAGVHKVDGLQRTADADAVGFRGRGGLWPTENKSLTLGPGITRDLEFERWARKGADLAAGIDTEPLGTEISLQDLRKDLVIEVVNRADRVILAYNVSGCLVSEFEPFDLPDLDATANAVAFQTMRLETAGWERDLEAAEPAEPDATGP